MKRAAVYILIAVGPIIALVLGVLIMGPSDPADRNEDSRLTRKTIDQIDFDQSGVDPIVARAALNKAVEFSEGSDSGSQAVAFGGASDGSEDLDAEGSSSDNSIPLGLVGQIDEGFNISRGAKFSVKVNVHNEGETPAEGGARIRIRPEKELELDCILWKGFTLPLPYENQIPIRGKTLNDLQTVGIPIPRLLPDTGCGLEALAGLAPNVPAEPQSPAVIHFDMKGRDSDSWVEVNSASYWY